MSEVQVEKISRDMSSAIYFRVFGQTAALAIHGVNSLVMLVSMLDQALMKDPEIKQMTDMQSLYLTVWNVFFVLLYFTVALACDAATITNRDHLIAKSVRTFRHNLFTVFVFPTSFLIFEIFWPVFIYDRSLLFPAFIDKIFSFKSNLVIHGTILPLALWELMFLPRTEPKSHFKNLRIGVLYCVSYIGFVLYNYAKRGVFPYPILHMLYGTIYFPISVIATSYIYYLNYRLQWIFTTKIWGNNTIRNKSHKIK